MKKAASVSALVAASLLSGCVICFNAHPAPSPGAGAHGAAPAGASAGNLPPGFDYRVAVLTLLYERSLGGDLPFIPVPPPDYGDGDPAAYALYYYYELRDESQRGGLLSGLYYAFVVHYLCEAACSLPEPYSHLCKLYLEERGDALYASVLPFSQVYGSFEHALFTLTFTVYSTSRTIVKAVEAGDEATLENALRINLLALASCVRTALHSAAPASLLAGRYWAALVVISGGALGGLITAELRKRIRRVGRW